MDVNRVEGGCLPSLGWAVVGQRMVVVRIVILSARTWQDVVDLNFLRMGEPENKGRDSHPGRRLSPQASSVLCRYWEMRVWPSPLSDLGRSSRLSDPQTSQM